MSVAIKATMNTRASKEVTYVIAESASDSIDDSELGNSTTSNPAYPVVRKI